MNEKGQQVEIGIVIILLVVVFYLGYNYATSKYKIQTEELNKIKQEFLQLNESFNQLQKNYIHI